MPRRIPIARAKGPLHTIAAIRKIRVHPQLEHRGDGVRDLPPLLARLFRVANTLQGIEDASEAVGDVVTETAVCTIPLSIASRNDEKLKT